MKDYIHKEYPKTCDPKDFFGQVKRTVNGKPVPQDQIDMIIEAIVSGLSLEPSDHLFDLGCGNGALSAMLFHRISKYHGVDFSEYLVEVAKKNFERPGYTFEIGEANQYLNDSSVRPEYTKALCYGAFSYFERDVAFNVMKNIREKCPNVTRVYIGNIPDKNRAGNFFYKDIDYSQLIHDTQSATGIWWTKDEFKALADQTGWAIEFIQMPEKFFASHYRYDVLLKLLF